MFKFLPNETINSFCFGNRFQFIKGVSRSTVQQRSVKHKHTRFFTQFWKMLLLNQKNNKKKFDNCTLFIFLSASYVLCKNSYPHNGPIGEGMQKSKKKGVHRYYTLFRTSYAEQTNDFAHRFFCFVSVLRITIIFNQF